MNWPEIHISDDNGLMRTLNEQVGAWICWHRPLPHDVVQAKVQFVVCEQLL